MRDETRPVHEVAVIGAGFSGIGGAWHWNTYPGVAVDIPSFTRIDRARVGAAAW